MGRPARILLWTCCSLALLIAAALIVVDLQLAAPRLGPRVAKLLADSGVGGSINRIEASVDGTFSAEGIDLTLGDGTRLRAESIRGDLAMLRLLRGRVHLAELEAKGVDITLAAPAPAPAAAKPADPAAAGQDLGLGRFSTGPVAISGRVRLADGTELRLNARSEGLDPSGDAELRAGLAWPGRAAGAAKTDPRAELIATVGFARTLGAHGTSWRELAADIARLRVRLTTRDAGPLSAAGPQIDIDAAAGPAGLEGRLAARDAKGLSALDTHFALGDALTLKGKLNLAVADLGVLTPANRALHGRARGELTASVTPGTWQAAVDLVAGWDDLSAFSPTIASGTRCEWKVQVAARGDAASWSVDSALVEGLGGVSLRIRQPLRWRGGALPDDSSGAPIEISANEAPITALAPFLAPAGLVPVGGTWSIGAEITFAGGEASLACPRAPAIKGLEIEKDGAPLLSRINMTLPLRADRGGLAIQGFCGGVAGRSLVSGDASVRPGMAGEWQADLKLHVDLGDLAGQPGWENLPFDRLRGVTVDVATSLAAKPGAAPVLSSATASIRNAAAELLVIRQRSPIALAGALPTGPLFDARAADLPLESLTALVPGLGLSGTLVRADLTLGARSDGSWYVRSETGPIRFADAGMAWAGKPYLQHCDLSTELDLSFGTASVLRFEKTELSSRGRTLASGSATVPLGGGWPTAALRGELGALATQPFARALGQVAAGSYQATLAPKGAGGASCELVVRDAGFADRALRLNLAQVSATLEPSGTASTISGSFRIGATGTSEGRFQLRTEPRADGRNWQAKIDIAQLALDDLLGLAPPEDEAAPAGPNLTPDRQAAWAGQSGTLDLTLGKAGIGDLAVQDIALRASVEGDTARLASLSGKAMGGALSGEGTLAFKPGTPGGPYTLSATAGVANLDIAQVAALVEAMRGNAEGKANLRVTALARAPNLGQVAHNLAADLALDAGAGAVRMPKSAAAISKKVGKGVDVGVGIVGIAGLLGNNQAAKMAEKMAQHAAGLREIQEAVENYRYTKAEVRAQRLADGSLKLNRADIQGELLSVSAAGGLEAQPGASLLDWPIDVDAQLRGSGALGKYFRSLGYDNAQPSATGESLGPAIKVSGTINKVKTNLLDTLVDAAARVVDKNTPSDAGNEPASDGTQGSSFGNRRQPRR